MRRNIILFDLDGTLTDSGPGIMKAGQYALRAFGIERDWRELSFFVGPPLSETFAHFVSAENVDAAVAKFREYYQQDGWQLGSTALHGATAWQVSAPATGVANDQWLASGPIALPADLTRLSLRFWHQQSLKAAASGANCQDAGVLEISENGGQTWTPLTTGLEATPYDGPISAAFQNPLSGRRGWCGDPRGYTRTVAALDAYAGRTVQLRFRLGHDRFAHRAGINWAIDTVTVQACPLR